MASKNNTSKSKKSIAKPASRNSKIVIVESPTKAKTLTKLLPGWHIYASYGHVRDLPKSEMGIDIAHDFTPRYIIPRDKRKRVNELKKVLDASHWIYLATDPDREGEAIAWHIKELLDGSAKDKEIKRVTFHEITASAITEAFKNPQLIDYPLVNSQQARRVLDRIFGYTLSPLLWQKVKKGLSAGRVQSVAVRLIVEREKEITDFVPKEYWNLKAIFSTGNETNFETKLIKRDGKTVGLKNKEGMDEVLAQLKKSTHKVAHITREDLQRNPQPPFMTSTLQRHASSNLGFTAKRTMQAAQSLYEQGFITYMRTDSLNLSESFLTAARQVIENKYGKQYIPAKPRYFKSRVKVAQEAHEAIRPTNPALMPDGDLKEKISRDEMLIYSTIWKRAVGSQMSPAIVDQRTVDVESQSDDLNASRYTFRAIGRETKFDGFLVLFPQKDTEEEKEEESVVLPTLSEGQMLLLQDLLPEQKFTEPPARFTEGTLIKTLEEYGIGRPSTYAPIISTIQERYYVEKEEGKFHPTNIGETVNSFLIEYFANLLDYDFTARMEENLDEVARGKEDWVSLVRTFYTPFEKTLEEVSQKAEHVEIELEQTDEICDKCGKPMVVRTGRFGRFLACSGFPDCKSTKPLVKKASFVCPKCGGDVVVKRTKKGKMFYGCSNYPNCDYASWKKPSQKDAAVKTEEAAEAAGAQTN